MFTLLKPNMHESEGKVVALADVDSASAAVALVRVGARGKPSHILATHRSFLPIENRSQEQSEALVVLALADAAHKVIKAAQTSVHGTASTALYVVARGPWINTLIFEGNESFDTDKKITNPYLIEFAQKVLAEGRERFVDPPFEANISAVELNGYPTRVPVGKYARMIRTTVLASSVEPDFRVAVEHALGNAFPHLVATWRSHTCALLEALRTAPLPTRNCVVVDVAGEETTLMTIRKDTMVTRTVIPSGIISITQKVSPRGLPEETLTRIRAFENDSCSSEECKRVGENLGTVEQWLAPLIGEQFTHMADPRRLPGTLFLLAPTDITPWLTRFFARIDFAPFTVTTLPFITKPISIKELATNIVSDETSDTSLLFACALVHTELSR